MKFLIIIGVAFFGFILPDYIGMFAKNLPKNIPISHNLGVSIASAVIATGIIYW